MSRAENFFKHADKDPDGLYSLDPVSTEALLAEASRKYIELTGEYPPYLHAFLSWFVIQHREMFKENPEIGRLLERLPLDLVPDDRRKFFREFLAIGAKLVG